jgi:FkbM family methyltransferase
MLLSKCRKFVDSYAPRLGRSYRLLRDTTNRRLAIRTPYGFSLAGDPTMAGEDWETHETAAFLELIETHDIVLDIGANVGFYSCLAASRGKRTVAFEPSARNLNYLYRNLWDNHLLDVEVFPLGLGKQPGISRMYGYGGIASFVPGWAQARVSQSSIVPLSTLDTVMAGRLQCQRALIKMDVEGFELEVLAGAAKILSLEPKPTWLVEIALNGDLVPGGINRRFTEAFALFWKHGYLCYRIDAPRTPVEPADIERWVATGLVDSGAHDFLFAAK